MRRWLQLTLWATVGMSVVALWPRRPVPVVEAKVPSSSVQVRDAGPGGRGASGSLAIEPLRIEAAAGDPFEVAVRRAPAVAVVAPAPVPVAPVASAVPAPPAVTYRYYGRLTKPGGEVVTLLSQGDAPVVVEPGLKLSDGYVVQAILPDAVRLSHASGGVVVDVPIPPPPTHSALR